VSVNPLVAARVEDPKSPWAGVWIAEDIELIAQGVENGSWIDGTLGVVGAGLDGLALVSDPVGALLQYGIAWLIEHVRPLSEALDWLAGDPSRIAAEAATWRNVASALTTQADDLTGAVRADLADWSGAAAAAYREWAARREQTLRTLSRASETAALITEAAGTLIGTVRLLVRDAVATVVSRLIVYAGELLATAGLATPLVVEQVTSLCAAWGARIAGWLRSLLASLRRLGEAMRRLGRNVDDLKTPGRVDDLTPKPADDLTSRTHEPSGPSEPDLPEEPPASPAETSPPPDFSGAEPDPNKISRYAMNPDHPTGRHKYRVIHSATGLDVDDAALIEQQIREGVRSGTPILGRADQHGQRWAVDVPLTGPSGTITVRTAWIVDAGATAPRMVTISFPKQEP
jgi:hypothetical protein